MMDRKTICVAVLILGLALIPATLGQTVSAAYSNGGGGGYGGSGYGGGGSSGGGSWGSGGGKGDPIMTDFLGRAFEFFGKVGEHYNILSEQNHQVTMRLKLGQMWDHNGTYIDGLGFRYRDFKVFCELEGDNMKVYLDGMRLRMEPNESEQEHIMAIEQGEMMLLWQLHRPDAGQAVQITTDLLNLVVYVTPAGTIDEGGVVQPAYLNFDAELLAPPTGQLKGLIGEGYDRLAATTGVVAEQDDFKFHGKEEEYVMSEYFTEAHKHNAFGVPAKVHSKRRLMERVNIAFPLRFSSKMTIQAPTSSAASVKTALGRKAF